MSEKLAAGPKVVGAKQVRRALANNQVARLYIAMDADPRLLQPLVQKCVHLRAPIQQVSSMKALGQMCGISVGAAIAALLRE